MVSVIIPTYNYGRFIGETLQSVKDQTEQDFECLIVDNGSTDNTAEVVQKFLADPRFRYIKQQNLGVSGGRNRGLKEAKGKYIQFLDADDLVEKNKLKAAVAYLEAHPKVQLVYSDMRYFKSEKPDEHFYNFACEKNGDTPWMSYKSGKGREMAVRFLEGNLVVISSPVFRISLIDKIGAFDESIQHNEDWDFWFRIALNNNEIHYLDKPDTRTLVRIHPHSASRNVFKMQVCGVKVLQKNSDKIKGFDLDKQLERRMKDHERGIRRSLLTSKNRGEYKERVSELRRLGLYKNIFGREVGEGLLSKLVLRLKSLSGQ